MKFGADKNRRSKERLNTSSNNNNNNQSNSKNQNNNEIGVIPLYHDKNNIQEGGLIDNNDKRDMIKSQVQIKRENFDGNIFKYNLN